jgi:DNA-binding transcriptional regulator YiaG
MSLRLKRELFGIVPKGSLRENPCDASPRTCQRKRLAHATPHASRFLNARIAPSHFAADSGPLDTAFIGSSRNRWVRGREGFNGRVSISVLHTVYRILHLLAHRNCRHVRLGLNPCVTISTDFFGYFLPRKESNNICKNSRGLTTRHTLAKKRNTILASEEGAQVQSVSIVGLEISQLKESSQMQNEKLALRLNLPIHVLVRWANDCGQD